MSNDLPHDAELFKCGNSKNSFRSRVRGFSNNRYCFLFSWEKGFSTSTSGTGEPSTLHHEQTISGEEMHTEITLLYG